MLSFVHRAAWLHRFTGIPVVSLWYTPPFNETKLVYHALPVNGNNRHLLLVVHVDGISSGAIVQNILSYPALVSHALVVSPCLFCACRCYVLQKQIADRSVPTLIVGCKADQKPMMQDYELQPNQFCRKHQLPPPFYFSVADKLTRDVYFKLATMAAYP